LSLSFADFIIHQGIGPCSDQPKKVKGSAPSVGQAEKSMKGGSMAPCVHRSSLTIGNIGWIIKSSTAAQRIAKGFAPKVILNTCRTLSRSSCHFGTSGEPILPRMASAITRDAWKMKKLY
jgi:hypothetical protein